MMLSKRRSLCCAFLLYSRHIPHCIWFYILQIRWLPSLCRDAANMDHTGMKKILLLCCCLLFAAAGFAQSTMLSQDSLGDRLYAKWKFKAADSVAFADTTYNDDGWQLVNLRILPYDSLDRIVWLRLDVYVDSFIASRPIAMRLAHLGASEVYLDGKRVLRFGTVAAKDSVEYEDPQYAPRIIDFRIPGRHLLAIRYANYDAVSNKKIFGKSMSGITVLFQDTRTAVDFEGQSRLGQTFVLSLLFGIFIAFSLLHFLMFLYYRSEISNFSFSMFTLMLGLIFLVSLMVRYANTPWLEIRAGYMAYFFGIGACFFLHIFLRHIFGRRNRFSQVVVYLAALAALVLRFVDLEWALNALVTLIVAVSVEAVITVVVAIYRKVKGAMIIGFGLVCFTGLILIIISVTIASGGYFEVNDDSDAGFYWFLAIIFAIISIPVSMSAYLAYRFSYVNKDLQAQLNQVQLLSEKTIQQEQENKKILERQNEELEQQVTIRTAEVRLQKEQIEQQHEALKAEKKKSDDLLLNILPSEVAEELKAKGSTHARMYDQVTVLFTDFVDFTVAGEQMGAQELVDELDHCFKAFDEIISRNGIEKIKTIGDAYLAVCGLPNPHNDHATRAVRAAMEIRDFMETRKQLLGERTFRVRIGMHSGAVVAGIVGVKKFAYDIWGDTVNTAARMEQNSEPGKINVTETTYELIREQFTCSFRGEINAKNKGALKMYFVTGEKR